MAKHTSYENQNIKKQDGAQSIHRAIALIHVVAKHNQSGAKLSKIARCVELPSSTTHRILNVLVDEGLINYNSQSRLYHLGIGLYILGSEAKQYQLRDIYKSTLENVAEQTGDTAFLVIREGYDVLCIDRVVGSDRIKVLSFDVGDRRPLGVGAGSLAILASLPEDQVNKIVQHNEPRYAFFRGFAPEDLKRMIQSYRTDGYAVNSVTPHIVSVGVCLRDCAGDVLGAISVSGIVSKMDTEEQKKIARLIQKEINSNRH